MKPIIFSTPMVQAILDGKKTQTRRVIKIDDAPENWKISIAGTSIVRTEPYDVKLPRYAVGDVLWVRETWNYSPNWYYCYKADAIPDDNHGYIGSIPWRPSIFMPREAARLFLRVKNVRVERLQEITVEDVMAEGLGADNEIRNPNPATHESIKNWNLSWAQFIFKELWDNINGKRGYGWDTNCWVWVYEFEKISKE